jgi:predicted nuclease with TOPRIM domain
MVKGGAEMKGLKETRTMHGSQKRSMPRVKSSAYLDLFILGKEKDRLLKELSVMEKRKEGLDKRLAEIAVEWKKLDEAKVRERRLPSDESGDLRPKDWKKIPVTY